MRPRRGRIVGALSGMMLAGPAWLYGLCVGFLLGYMVDTVITKVATGFTGSGPGSGGTGNDSAGTGTHPPVADTEAVADTYRQLGLTPGASMAEVKKAWRLRSRHAHPDAPGGAAEDFMILKKAYEKILEEKKADPTEE